MPGPSCVTADPWKPCLAAMSKPATTVKCVLVGIHLRAIQTLNMVYCFQYIWALYNAPNG